MVETLDFFLAITPTFIVRGGFAILCGAIIGIERERKGKPAGFRTNTLICLGSALYMLISEFLFQRMGLTGTDPTRIAAQIVTGIGFLGAGTIIQSQGNITGLTTAATIWVVAGIGVCIGAGFPLLGLCSTILVLITLVVLRKIEPRLLGKCHMVSCYVVFANDGGRTRAEISYILSEHDIDISNLDITRVDDKISRLRLQFCDRHPSHSRFLSELWRTTGIVEVTREKQDPSTP